MRIDKFLKVSRIIKRRTLAQEACSKEKSNEYYGFFDIFGRYASVMGTFLVSVVTSLTGNPSLGVLSIGVLLVVGFMLLVRLSRMTRAAEHAA